MDDLLVSFLVNNDLTFLKKNIQKIININYAHIKFLFVDDGSNDGSADFISDYNIQFIFHEMKLGPGACLQSSLRFAMDYSISNLIVMPVYAFNDWRNIIEMAILFNKYDIINAKRENVSSYDEYSNFVNNFNIISGLNLKDPLSLIKGLKVEHGNVYEITEDSYEGILQFLIQSKYFNLKLYEHDYNNYDFINDFKHYEPEDFEYLINFAKTESFLYPYIKNKH